MNCCVLRGAFWFVGLLVLHALKFDLAPMYLAVAFPVWIILIWFIDKNLLEKPVRTLSSTFNSHPPVGDQMLRLISIDRKGP